MRARVGTLAGGIVVLSLLLSASAGAFCLRTYTGFKTNAKWKTVPVSYKVSSNLKDQALLDAIDKAFQTWGSVACSNLTFKNDGSFDVKTDFKTHGYLGIYVFWYDEASKSSYPSDAKYAIYSFSGHDNNGGIVFGSLALNGFAFKWNATGGDNANAILDLQNEMIYLIGSVLGLTDSTSATSVMKAQMAYGSTDRHTLKQDDIDAIVYMYPENDGCNAPEPAADCSGVTPPPVDAGPTPDGTTPPPTDGSPASDSTTPPGDGGPEPGDGSTTESDATTTAGDGGDDSDGGCGCGVGGLAGGAPAVAALLLLSLMRRRND